MKPRRGVTRIGWIGLGLSILAVALLFLTGWLFNASLSFSAGNAGPDVGSWWALTLLATAVAFVAGITTDVLAGNRGLGNRLVGILGGMIMIAPAIYILTSLVLSYFGIVWP